MGEPAANEEDKIRRERSPDRNTMQRRWKAATLVLASACIRTTGNFALSHADAIHRSRWKEITGFVNIQSPIPEPQFITDPSGLSFFAASMGFVALASAYHQRTCYNTTQVMIVLCVGITGLLVVWRSGVGMLVGLYCVETWFVLLGLVVSDIFQAACQRRTKSREVVEEQTATGLEMKWKGGFGSPV